MSVVVVGFGQPLVGDDAIGILVARSLAGRGLTVIESTDPTMLLAIVASGRKIIVVDAIVGGGSPGDVLHLRHDSVALSGSLVSSHGIGVGDALALANLLHPGAVGSAVDIVAVVIAAPQALDGAMSPEVAAAILPAAELVERIARGAQPSITSR